MKEEKKDSLEINREQDIDNTEGTTSTNKIKAVALEIIMYLFIIFLCVFVIPKYVIQRTIVDGPSMENTLHDGENLLVEKISYKVTGLKRYDIIVFYPYGREHKEYYVKRVIGLPGETVQIIGSDIYINGEIIHEEYGKEAIVRQGIAKEPLLLGEDEIFVLGDNRTVSLDSRYEEVGPVDIHNVEGKVLLRVWPLKKFGPVK